MSERNSYKGKRYNVDIIIIVTTQSKNLKYMVSTSDKIHILDFLKKTITTSCDTMLSYGSLGIIGLHVDMSMEVM